MIATFKRAGLAVALAAASVGAATTAEARDRYRDRGDDAALIIGAGIVGLAIGAALADRDDRHYHDRDWYPRRRYVRVHGYPDYYYYYPGRPNHYYRDRYYDRYYRGWQSRRYSDRWDRGYSRGDRYYGRGDRYYDRGRYDRYDRNGYRRDRRYYRGY